MSQISASLVKTLRERTGLGMMECKKALVASQGNIDEAIKTLRESGQMKASGKSGRVTAEGVVVAKVSDNHQYGVLLEVNCETDFVARDEGFLSFVNQVLETAFTTRITEVASLMELNDLEAARQELIQKIGENITVRRIVLLEDDCVGSYVHNNKRMAALVSQSGGTAELASNIAMHVTAVNPSVLNRDEVDPALVAQEKEIFMAQAGKTNKPANIIEQMVTGRINKFLAEISLVEQPFVQDPNIKVGDLAKKENAKVTGFARFSVGEGIEKKENNFAEEVRAQAGLS